ncbi:oligosaccharide flippase family protein [Carboxylicivirga taeanensis]|uniref:oligosaccharide flippase family protein n=1 Tax=Carboxylicivirga taeanensis TaxID=1416875 RepID=UPI003F6DBD3E
MLDKIRNIIHRITPNTVRKRVSRIKESEFASRVLKASFWSILNTVFIRAFGLLSTVLVARIIGKEAYGELGIINSTVGLYGTFAGFGLSVTTIKYIAEYVKKDPIKVSKIISLTNVFSLSLGSIFVIGLFFMADWLSSETLAAPLLTPKLQLSSILIILYSWNGVQVGILSGFESFKKMAKIGAIVGLSNLPFIVGGAYLYDIYGVLGGMILSQLLICILYRNTILKECKIRGIKPYNRDFWDEKHTLISFTLPSFLSGIVMSPVNWTANAFLVKTSDGFAEMGTFSAVERISTIAISIMAPISQALLPIFISKFSDKKASSNNRLDRLNISITWVMGLTIILPILVFPELSELLFGDDFHGLDFRKTLIITMLSTSIIAHRQGIARSFIAKSYLWLSVSSNVFWGLLVVLFSYYLIEYGAIGRAAAVLFAYIINTLFFIPIYIKLKLAPVETLNSREAISIWICLGVMAYISYNDFNLIVRSIGFLITCYVFVKSFYRISR